jgi:serine/threonine-protein kinase RIO1
VRRSHKTVWTEEENDRLKAMVAKGVSIARASVAFQRSIISIRNQARKLGTPFPLTREVRQQYAAVFSGDPR